MKARPILFMDSMVAAILDGRKTVTRRVGKTWAGVQPGARLWVREAWRPVERESDGLDGTEYRAGGFEGIENTPEAAERWVMVNDRRDKHGKRRTGWRPSIHMPRWACRIELEVVSLTVEQSMAGGRNGYPAVEMPGLDLDEARREGFASRADFLAAWRSMHSDYTGPVYRVEFRRAP